MYSRSMKGSLMATISTFLEVKAARVTRRPMRPNLERKKFLRLACRWRCNPINQSQTILQSRLRSLRRQSRSF